MKLQTEEQRSAKLRCRSRSIQDPTIIEVDNFHASNSNNALAYDINFNEWFESYGTRMDVKKRKKYCVPIRTKDRKKKEI